MPDAAKWRERSRGHQIQFGSITLDNELVLFDSPSKAIKHGMAMVQEDRKGLSLFMGLSVSENISISRLA